MSALAATALTQADLRRAQAWFPSSFQRSPDGGGAARVDPLAPVISISRGGTEGSAEAEPPPHAALEALAINVARCAIDALAGTRDVDQLARWVTPGVFQRLLVRVQYAERARQARRRAVRRIVTRVRSLVVQHTPSRVDATIVIDCGPRTRAVCVRLQPLDSRWRASDVTVL